MSSRRSASDIRSLTQFWSAPLLVILPPRDSSIFDGDLSLLEIPFFVVVGLVIAAIVHEAGHAVCCALAGLPIRLVSIGGGPVLARFHISNTQVVLRQAPIFGAVHLYPPLVVERGKLLFCTLGGFFGNLAAVVLIVTLGSEDLVPESLHIGAVFVAVMQLIVGVGNLIPIRAGEQTSDGLDILRLLRLPPRALTAEGRRYAAWRARYATGQPSPASSGADSVCMAYYLDLVETRTTRVGRKAFRKAAQRALTRGALAPDEQMLVLDALVSIGAASHDPEYLGFLDEWSCRALALNPALETLRGSRGAALVTLGRHAEGKALLASIDGNTAPGDFAISQVLLAKTELTLGDKEAARRSLAAARSVNGESIAFEPWATMIRDIELALGAPLEAETHATAT